VFEFRSEHSERPEASNILTTLSLNGQLIISNSKKISCFFTTSIENGKCDNIFEKKF